MPRCLACFGRPSVVVFLLITFNALGITGTAVAQTDSGALRVLVTDQSEAVVPGATIEVVNAATETRHAVRE